MYSEAMGLGEVGEGCAFGGVLADEAVGVFVGAALPGLVWVGEVEGGAEMLFDELVSVELGTVVGGDGLDFMWSEDLDDAGLGVLNGRLREFAEAEESGFAVYGREEGGFVCAVHGIKLPVSFPRAGVDDGRALGDHAFAGEATAAVGAAIAFTPLFGSVTKMKIKAAATGTIGSDPLVDGRDTHDLDAFPNCAADDLLRAKIFAEEALYLRKIGRGVALVATRASQTAAVEFSRGGMAVAAVVRGHVAIQLTANGSRVAPERSGYLRVGEALCP